MRARWALIAALAVSSAGCGQAPHAGSRQSVTVKLAPARPYKPDPGFTLATDLPRPAKVKAAPRG